MEARGGWASRFSVIFHLDTFLFGKRENTSVPEWDEHTHLQALLIAKYVRGDPFYRRRTEDPWWACQQGGRGRRLPRETMFQ